MGEHRKKLHKAIILLWPGLLLEDFRTDAGFVRSDFPTCSKEGFRIALVVIASKGWSCNSLDIKTAFFQMDRSVYLLPPPEAVNDR